MARGVPVLPEVICLRLDVALSALEEAGYKRIRVAVTHPPRGETAGEMRVIAQRVFDGEITLVCSRELKRKGVGLDGNEDHG
ncbi:MAG TPA: hypothetical protein GX507_03925 [Clostridia bacterium]|nr:hypothetical protein [Clostridia bacterium]